MKIPSEKLIKLLNSTNNKVITKNRNVSTTFRLKYKNLA